MTCLPGPGLFGRGPPSCVTMFGDSLTCRCTCQRSRVAPGQTYLPLNFNSILWIHLASSRPSAAARRWRHNVRRYTKCCSDRRPSHPPSSRRSHSQWSITKRPHVGRSVGRRRRRAAVAVDIGDDNATVECEKEGRREGRDEGKGGHCIASHATPGQLFASAVRAPMMSDLFRQLENRNNEELAAAPPLPRQIVERTCSRHRTNNTHQPSPPTDTDELPMDLYSWVTTPFGKRVTCNRNLCLRYRLERLRDSVRAQQDAARARTHATIQKDIRDIS